MIQKALQFKLIRYALTGGVATAIHLLVAYGYLYYIDDALFWANTLGFLLAFLFSYSVQSIFVFKHAIKLAKALKFFLVQFTSLLISISFSSYVPLENSYLQTIVVILVLPLITYLIHKFWTFKEH